MTTRKAILVTPRYTLLSATEYGATPTAALRTTPAGLADMTRKLFGAEGVVLLDQEMTKLLNVTESWETHAFPGQHIYIGALPLIDWCPLVQTQELPGSGRVVDVHEGTVDAFSLYHELLGVAYHRSPGVAGLSLLQRLHPKGKAKPIVWETPGPVDAAEVPYNPANWRGTVPDACFWRHGYDRRRAGLGALNVAYVARYALRHDGRKTFDHKRAGWWLCEVPPWNDPRMPDPAGYGPEPGKLLRWLSTPRVELLNELAVEGVSPGVRIIRDSWTAERSRLFFTLSERIDKAHDAAEAIMAQGGTRALTAELVRDTTKDTYREIDGMFAGADSWVSRPDWMATLRATNAANTWRACWRIGKETGRWPYAIDGDKVWYADPREDAILAVPKPPATWPKERKWPMTIGTALGEWRHDGTVAL